MTKKSFTRNGCHRSYAQKLLLIMKLSSILLLLFTLPAAASGYSQSDKIKLTSHSGTIADVIEAIENQTEYKIFYKTDQVNVYASLKVQDLETTVGSLLDETLENSDLTYSVVGKIIVLQKESKEQFAAGKKITGKVTDKTGGPLPGVTVVIKGTTTGTTTDVNGVYTINDVPDEAILVFTYIGMTTQEFSIAGKTSIDVILEDASVGLSEVVVIGYGTSKKADLTGAIVSADLKQFRESPNTNIIQSLQGSLPGVTIGQIAAAGAEPDIKIRGRNTLSGNDNPLIVVDGVIYRGRLSDLNPNDIQSVDVLKDPSSKAIYGAQAANGIVMVTTKGGKKNQKTQVTYSGFYSMQSPIKNRRNLNREEFINAGRDTDYTHGFLAPDYIQPNPAWDYGQVTVLGSWAFAGYNNGSDYNWYEETTNPSSKKNHQLSVKGGSDKTSFFFSGGYSDELGWVINDNYKRITTRMNVDTKVYDWLSIGTNTFGSFSNFSGQSPNLSSLPVMMPIAQPKNDKGDYVYQPMDNAYVNPFLQVQADDYDHQNNISSLVYALINVPKIEGLTYRVNYSYNYRWSAHNNSDKYGQNQTGSAYKISNNTNDVSLDNILTYDKRFGANKIHGIKATIVAGFNTNQYSYTKSSATGFSNLNLSYNSLQSGVNPLAESHAWNESFLSQTARIGYDYNGKYLLSASLRRDGYSGFSENHKTAVFPSVGLGWIITKEALLENIKVIDLLKIRGSFGVNGNTTSRYSSLARLTSDIGASYLYNGSQYVFGDGGTTQTGVYVSTLANKDLTWEQTHGYNIGVDFGFFDSRITGNVDYYISKTKDLLWDLILPSATGFTSIKSNVGEIQNSGLEFVLNIKAVQKEDWNWVLGFNYAKNNNKINHLLGQDNNEDGKEDDLIANGLFIGQSIGSVYTYIKEGIYQIGDVVPTGFSVGGYKFKDISGPDGIPDGKISAEYDRTIIGKAEADYQFGITNTVSYKGFALKFFINSIQGGIGKNEPWNDPQGFYGKTSTVLYTNRYNDIDSWSPTNPDAEYALPGITSPVSFSPYQNRSFIRLQDVSLSYTFDQDLLKKAKISDLRVFASGKNLFTSTKWDGWDPETGAGLEVSNSGLPVMKSFTLGLEVSF